MIRRRAFLVLLTASLAARFAAARAARTPDREPTVRRNKPGLLIHKGWILRADDPRY